MNDVEVTTFIVTALSALSLLIVIAWTNIVSARKQQGAIVKLQDIDDTFSLLNENVVTLNATFTKLSNQLQTLPARLAKRKKGELRDTAPLVMGAAKHFGLDELATARPDIATAIEFFVQNQMGKFRQQMHPAQGSILAPDESQQQTQLALFLEALSKNPAMLQTLLKSQMPKTKSENEPTRVGGTDSTVPKQTKKDETTD
ncbi:MAG: hypothetical protein ACE5OZ_24260 [Candidatus Heimdallarchaeota archaeon]